MVATLPLIIPIGTNIVNIIVASYSSAGGKENFFPVFMSDKRKRKKTGKSKNSILASCLTSAPSCGALAAIPNPKIWFSEVKKNQDVI